MNPDDDFIAGLEDYLDTYDGVVPLPESVRTTVRERLPGTPQVHSPDLPDRMRGLLADLSAPVRYGIGVAAVLVIVAGAAVSLTGRVGPGVGADPATATSSTPVPLRSPTPAPASSPRGLVGAPEASCGDGLGTHCVAAGTYAVTGPLWPGTITLDIPTGWFNWDPAVDFQSLLVEMGADSPAGSGWGIAISPVDTVSKDPCDATAGTFASDQTASAAGVVDAMRAWPGFEVSAATPIDVDGRPGQLVQVTSSRTAKDCEGSVAWTTPSGLSVDAYPMAGVPGVPRAGTFRVIDVAGAVLVIRTTEFGDPSPHELDQGVKPDPLRHAVDQAELRSIVDSIRIET